MSVYHYFFPIKKTQYQNIDSDLGLLVPGAEY